MKSKSVAFEDLFDPDVVGDGPTAPGYTVSGVPLRFAAIKYGAKRADVGYAENGVDLSNKWAAKGTASYSLSINGQSYSSAYNINSGSGHALIGFRIVSGNTWQVYSIPNGGATSVLASGSVPGGASSVKYTFGAYTVPSGFLDSGGGTSNAAAAATAISSNPGAYYQTSDKTATSGSRARTYPLTIDFYSASGSNISSTGITLTGETEGSI